MLFVDNDSACDTSRQPTPAKCTTKRSTYLFSGLPTKVVQWFHYVMKLCIFYVHTPGYCAFNGKSTTFCTQVLMGIRAITDLDLVGGKQEIAAILQDGCRAFLFHSLRMQL